MAIARGGLGGCVSAAGAAVDAIAPGARALIRDEEWIVRVADLCDVGGYQLDCIGVSETVRHRDAIFLTEIDTVTVFDPRQTERVRRNLGRRVLVVDVRVARRPCVRHP